MRELTVIDSVFMYGLLLVGGGQMWPHYTGDRYTGNLMYCWYMYTYTINTLVHPLLLYIIITNSHATCNFTCTCLSIYEQVNFLLKHALRSTLSFFKVFQYKMLQCVHVQHQQIPTCNRGGSSKKQLERGSVDGTKHHQKF